jgi:hypothetical protein
LKSFIRSLYGAVVADVGWNKAEGEAHTTSLKRSLVLKAMGGADDADTIKLAMEKFQGLISGSGSVDADLKLLVYSLAVAHGGEDAYTALLSMYRDPSTMSEEKVCARSPTRKPPVPSVAGTDRSPGGHTDTVDKLL